MMNNTKANVLAVIEKMVASKKSVANATYGEAGSAEHLYIACSSEAMALEQVIKMFSDKEYFNEIVNIYMA